MQSNNNTVLVTGGGSGIGLAIAEKFMKEGNKVIIVGRSQEKLSYIKQRYPHIGTEIADITDEKTIKTLANKYQDVNILINNAGVHYHLDMKDSQDACDKIRQEIDTNLVAPILLSKLFVPSFLKKKSSAIINISSYFGISPKPSAPGYSASKAGLRSFSKSLRTQLLGTSIKVFDIAPPIVETQLTAASNSKNTRKMKPEELAEIFWDNFLKDNYEVYPGLARFFYIMNRLRPKYLENKIVKVTMK